MGAGCETADTRRHARAREPPEARPHLREHRRRRIGAAVRAAGEEDRWWLLLIQGILGVLASLVAFFWPGLTALALLYFIAAWAIVTGIMEIVAAIRLRQEIEGEWALGLSGLLSVIFGILLVVLPAPAGLLSLVWLVGAYAVATGVLLLILAFRVRSEASNEARPRPS